MRCDNWHRPNPATDMDWHKEEEMATKKRKTKAQREAEQREALKRRVLDIAAGAAGGEAGLDDEGYELANVTCGPKELSRFITAVEAVFGDQVAHHDQAHSMLSRHWNIAEYDSFDSTIDFLWSMGVRA